MNVAVIGVNHETASILVREKLAFTESKKIEATDLLLEKGIEELIIISTCNRSEIYITSNHLSDAIKKVENFFSTFFKIDDIKAFLFAKEGEVAIEYLYKVTAGLHSLVLGEDQILGQVKEALAFSIKLGSSGKVLNKLFREAISISKKIKTETKMSEYPLSISYIGIKFLKEKLGSLRGKSALLIGMGKMNQLSLQYLLEEEIEKIYLVNRNLIKSKQLSLKDERLIPIEYHKRYEVLDEVDIVISSTAAPHTVLHLEEMPLIKKPLYLMDIAVPRDIETSIGHLEQVYLYDLDNLQEISDQNSLKRKQLAKEAEAIIADNIQDFILWMENIKIDPTLMSLNQRCETIYQDTMAYIRQKAYLDHRQDKIIDKMVKSSLKRLIREPIAMLKSIQDTDKQAGYIEMIEELFEIKESEK